MEDQQNAISKIELVKMKLEILLKDYELTNSKIERFVGNQFVYTQGALLLTGSYIAFLVEGIGKIEENTDTKLYLQFLPYFILFILGGVLYQYQRTIGLQGYKQYLEDAINKLVEENMISYGHIGMRFMLRKSAVSAMNLILYVLLYVAGCLLAYYKPDGVVCAWWPISHVFFFLVFIAIGFWQTTGYSNTVRDAARKLNNNVKPLSEIDIDKIKVK